MKIWKGLHYCMWMQDKPLIQVLKIIKLFICRLLCTNIFIGLYFISCRFSRMFLHHTRIKCCLLILLRLKWSQFIYINYLLVYLCLLSPLGHRSLTRFPQAPLSWQSSPPLSSSFKFHLKIYPLACPSILMQVV